MPIAKKYQKDFFKTWSHDMAYILGFLYADGNVTKTKRGTHFVALYTADHALLSMIKQVMGAEHKISIRSSKTGAVYRIQIGSRTWFDDLGQLGLFPQKTKRILLPVVPKKYFGSFVRGYFDGDGNVWVGYLNKKRKTPTRVITVSFTSCAHDFLRALQQKLQGIGVCGGCLYTSKTRHYSRLSFSIHDALKIYKIMYTVPHKLCLTRKKVVFEKFVKMRG